MSDQALVDKFMHEWRVKNQQNGYWTPPITDKQLSVAQSPYRYVLASGPRHSGKTISTLNALANELYNVPNCDASFLGISQTNATDAGAWEDFTDIVMPEWINGGFGMKWHTQPKMEPYTHKPYFEVTNRWGGVSRCKLFPLDREKDVEDIFKNRSFTTAYMTELSKFRRDQTFVTITECFRGPGRAPEHFKFIADTNPDPEGEQSWIWKRWFGIREKAVLNEFEKQFHVLEFQLDDNPFYSQAEKDTIRAKYTNDPNLYDRMVRGLWKRVAEGGYFQAQFRPLLHVVPNTLNPDEQEYMAVTPDIFMMMGGADLGEINHSAHIIEPTWHLGRKAYKILDEEISVGEEVSIESFTEALVEKVEFWESEIGRKPHWDWWSDCDAFDFVAAADTYKHKVVYNASRGKIEFKAAAKGPNSVGHRFAMIRRLLAENRIYVSSRCPQTIEAFRLIKKKTKGAALDEMGAGVDTHSKYKHAIDSLSYAILMDLGEEAMGEMVRHTKSPPGAIVEVAMG